MRKRNSLGRFDTKRRVSDVWFPAVRSATDPRNRSISRFHHKLASRQRPLDSWVMPVRYVCLRRPTRQCLAGHQTTHFLCGPTALTKSRARRLTSPVSGHNLSPDTTPPFKTKLLSFMGVGETPLGHNPLGQKLHLPVCARGFHPTRRKRGVSS